MREPYLEVTFRQGKPLAAYLYLARRPGDRAARSEPVDDALVVDRSSDGRPIGIEIVDPQAVTPQRLNALLRTLHQAELPLAELAPLRVA
jgi:uncharacterized protein YuzE